MKEGADFGVGRMVKKDMAVVVKLLSYVRIAEFNALGIGIELTQLMNIFCLNSW